MQEGRSGHVQGTTQQCPNVLDGRICHWRDPKQSTFDPRETEIFHSSHGGRPFFFFSCWALLTCPNSSSGLSWHSPCHDATLLPNSTFSDSSSVCSVWIDDCNAELTALYRSCWKYALVEPPLRPTPTTLLTITTRHFLPRNAVHHWFMVPKGWTGQALVHLPHEQRNWYHDFRVFDGWRAKPRWCERIQGMAMVSIIAASVVQLLIGKYLGYFSLTVLFLYPWLWAASSSCLMCRKSLIRGIWTTRRLPSLANAWNMKDENPEGLIRKRSWRRSFRRGESTPWLFCTCRSHFSRTASIWARRRLTHFLQNF